ncbi:MAG: MBL fold metallo-hydrolase, partial [Ilumatobacter sp.]|nr:MBL fold metallo-hydrolase [Ilumatobacter sp.]
MNEHPLDLSSRVIDSGVADAPVNRLTQELSELADGVALVESFSHAVVVTTDDGLVVFDTSGATTGPDVVAAIREWSDAPIASIVYTHGHLDHVGGSRAFAADADRRDEPRPRVVGQRRIIPRFARYEATSGYNRIANLRQFGGATKSGVDTDRPFVPPRTMHPDVVYDDRLTDHVGGVEFEHNACLGETDDHTWTWIPSCKTITAGDQFIWMFPNCGNPQKVQRYPLEWARSLREMASRD